MNFFIRFTVGFSIDFFRGIFRSQLMQMFLLLRGKFIADLSLKPGLLFFFFIAAGKPFAQSFDPPAGMPGSLAIPADSPEIKCWASLVVEEQRGLRNLADPAAGFATSGIAESSLGPALKNGVVSLGDGGYLTAGFPANISDKEGPDLAVFENGFSDSFLELASVEVSSNGVDFFAFPAVSETPYAFQKGPFDTLHAQNLYNLAGKYRAGFGTGFDLAELAGKPGLDISSIRFVRVRDVVGSVLPEFARRDSRGKIINDPWPTPFESGGFDLDAIAALNISGDQAPLIWPTVLGQGELFSYVPDFSEELHLYSAGGLRLMSYPPSAEREARLPAGLSPGMYFFRRSGNPSVRKILIR